MTWRYIAQRALTGEFLDMDLQVTVDDVEWVLSGAGSFRGTVAPDVGMLLAADGSPLLEEWGTLLYAESEGEIRWGGILVRSTFQGGAWAIEAAEFKVYPNGIPYTDYWGGVQVDPLDAVREIWRHVQDHPDAHLGVTVDSDSSPIRLGKPRVPGYFEVTFDDPSVDDDHAKWVREDSVDDPDRIIPKAVAPLGEAITDAAESTLAEDLTDTELSVTLTDVDRFDEVNYPADVMIGSEKVTAQSRDGKVLHLSARGVGSTTKSTHGKGIGVKVDGLTQTFLVLKTLDHFGDAKAPFDVTVGSETITVGGRKGLRLTNLTRGVGTSKVSTHSKGTDVTFDGTRRRKVDAIPAEPYELAWWDAPDCGSELATLATQTPFDFDEVHTWREDGTIAHHIRLGYPRLGRKREDLAFEQGVNIIGLGAGEGKKTRRVHVPDRDGRLRRPIVYTDKGVRSTDRLSALTRKELRSHRGLVEVQEVTVEDHPHAPIGSWRLGDDVLIQATVPWLGDFAIWHRIVGWTLVSDTRAKLALLRSDSFTYGRSDA